MEMDLDGTTHGLITVFTEDVDLDGIALGASTTVGAGVADGTARGVSTTAGVVTTTLSIVLLFIITTDIMDTETMHTIKEDVVTTTQIEIEIEE